MNGRKTKPCCDHLISSVFTLSGSQEVWRCCNCGRERKVRHKAEISSTLNKEDHGPFAPKEVIFGPSKVC